jgi:hypothetical protein
MSDWPRVFVIFATHKRTETCLQTIDSLQKYLKYPNIHYHIADDGSHETDDGTGRRHLDVLLERFRQFAPDVTWHEMDTKPGHFNTGGNCNRAITEMLAQGDNIYLLNFDDWTLIKELDIRPMADVLDTCPDVGFIRLSWLTPGISGVVARYDAPRSLGPYMWLRLIRSWSVENPWYTDSYLVSMQPFIAHIRFHEAYGLYQENVNPGICETEMTTRYLKHSLGESGPQILHPIGPCWDHSSYGHTTGRANDYAKV